MRNRPEHAALLLQGRLCRSRSVAADAGVGAAGTERNGGVRSIRVQEFRYRFDAFVFRSRDRSECIKTESKLRSEEHTSELQSRPHLVCRLLLEKKKRTKKEAL